MGNFISTFSSSLGAHPIELHNVALCSKAHTRTVLLFQAGTTVDTVLCTVLCTTCNIPLPARQWFCYITTCQMDTSLPPWLSHQKSVFIHWSKSYFAVCHTVHFPSSHPLLFSIRSKYYSKWDSWIKTHNKSSKKKTPYKISLLLHITLLKQIWIKVFNSCVYISAKTWKLSEKDKTNSSEILQEQRSLEIIINKGYRILLLRWQKQRSTWALFTYRK